MISRSVAMAAQKSLVLPGSASLPPDASIRKLTGTANPELATLPERVARLVPGPSGASRKTILASLGSALDIAEVAGSVGATLGPWVGAGDSTWTTGG